ncbi:MAG: hypothetical protein ACYTKD_20770 [Planctomycetota bacterium]|jgi:hypothetical protein
MRRPLALALGAAFLSCAAPTGDGALPPGRLQRITNPNVSVTLSRGAAIEHVNIKKGRTSFANYADYSAASPQRRAVRTYVDDSVYDRLRDLALRILKAPPTLDRIDRENAIAVSVLVLPDELAELGLARSQCTFAYRPGERPDADELRSIVSELLDRQRGRSNLKRRAKDGRSAE